MRGFLLLPLIPAATTPPSEVPPGLEREVRVAQRRAPTRAHPVPGSPFLFSFHFPRPGCVCPPPPEGPGLESPSPRSEFALVFSGALELSGRLSLPRAQRRSCRCRSLLSPVATLLRRVLPSLYQGCVSGNGPALPFRYQPVPERARGATLRAVALGSRAALQCATPQDLTAKTARRGPGISPRLVPACRL